MVLVFNAQPRHREHETHRHADGFARVPPERGARASQTTHIPAPTAAKQVSAP